MSIRMQVREDAPRAFPAQTERRCTKLVASDAGGVPIISLDGTGSDVSVIVDADGIYWADETPVGTNPRVFVPWEKPARGDQAAVTGIVSLQVTYADATAPGGAMEEDAQV